MNHIWKSSLIALFFLIFGQTILYSQSLYLPSDGKDFFVGFMYPSYNKVGNPSTAGFYGAYILVSSYTDNHIRVAYFDKHTGAEIITQTYSIPARTGIQIQLNQYYVQLSDSGDKPEFGACHVTADRAINVEFFSTGACAGGSFLPITTSGLGNKYVIASYNDNPGRGGLLGGTLGPSSLENSEGCFEIIAAFDSTKVTITPNATTMGGHRGVNSGAHSGGVPLPYTVNLRRGQCYLVKSGSTDSTVDISGSTVESNNPIAVIAGHENAFLGGLSGRSLEGRNFMIQQMIPVDDWDTTGYVSIPLKDSQPADPTTYDGVGENYRIYTYDSLGSNVIFYDQCNGESAMPVVKYAHPTPEREGVLCPVDFKSTNSKKFSVMMYDQRNFAQSAPYPAPSMMSIIPISHWRTSYLWYVPANKFETLQSYFANIICQKVDWNGAIVGSFNGGAIKPIKVILQTDAQFLSIPNHPELMGARFKLSSGSYYATGPHPFMVYSYGFRAIDPDFNLGDFDGDDFFFSYGSPAGMLIGNGQAHMRVTVDTFCSYWNVCIHDSTFGLPGRGIKSVTLLDDSSGDIIKPGYKYRNTRLDDSLDPGYPYAKTNEINFTGADSNICFKVLVNSQIDSAFAPLYIVNSQGAGILVQLKFKAPYLKLSSTNGNYLNTRLASDSCWKFVFYNLGDTTHQNGDTTLAGKDTVIHHGSIFTITSATLIHASANFSNPTTIPLLPANIKPGDSLVISECFAPSDTTTARDTILLINGDGTCFKQFIPLTGKAAIPMIKAGNRDFGSVIVDSTKCDTLSIRNNGTAPLLLTSQFVLTNTINFVFKDSSLLPITIQPGKVVYLTFCYTPHLQQIDSAIFYWSTNETTPYKHSIKDSSILYGAGVKTGFIWDRMVWSMTTDSTVVGDSTITRVFLLNTSSPGGPAAHVDSVYIVGQDRSEFYILENQLHAGSGTFGNFDLRAGDSIWVDIVFKPNLSKPYPLRYADRHADLVASDSNNGEAVQKNQVIHLTGTWTKSSVALPPEHPSFTIIPNPAFGNSIIISFATQQELKAMLGIYDILGREVYHKDVAQGISAIEIPIRNLPGGIYFARLLTDHGIISRKFEISH